MTAARGAIGALGVAAGLWGVWLISDDGLDRLVSVLIWLGGGVVLHDFVLAPILIVTGVVAARVLPNHLREVVAAAFLVWGAFTAAVANVLIGQGGKPDNESLLNRPYVTSWLVLTAVLAAAALVGVIIATGRRRRTEA